MPGEQRRERTPMGTARQKILDEALRLFVSQGYRATTIKEVAAGAGVAVQTVYFTFGNKRALLKELVDRNVAGDDEPVPTLQRPWLREAVAEPDPRRQLEIQVRAAGSIYRRVAPLLQVMRDTAGSEDEVGELWLHNQKQRRAVQRRLVTALARKHPLPGGLTVSRATDIAYALLGPEMYHLMVTERGWPVAEWERWVLRMLGTELLGDGTADRPDGAAASAAAP
ncbi:TetR/AcrR family transcriptional regulator [Micromonospora echinofusca]|nr:TetR/AcrR family transcriptional regulator [Micromonospora echinofusca]